MPTSLERTSMVSARPLAGGWAEHSLAQEALAILERDFRKRVSCCPICEGEFRAEIDIERGSYVCAARVR